MTVLPRRLLFAALALVVVAAILTATAEAALVYRAIGPIIAAALGVALFPALARGASSGTTRRSTAWAVAMTGCVLCCTATVGLDPDRLDCVSVSWYTCGVLAGAVMLWMAGHRVPPLVAVAFLVAQVTIWAGPLGMLRLGLCAEIVMVSAGLIMHSTMRRVTSAARAAAAKEREMTIWHAEQDAFLHERKSRLQLAAGNAVPMLQRIIDRDGFLDAASRFECQVLEQTLRDEIRGRRLLNDAVRRAVLAHRERGAFVQVLDDGGLDDLAPSELNPILDDLAQRIGTVRSSRIVIRTASPASDSAVTVVASTPDEIAAALGLEGDEQVDMWMTISRPTVPLAG